MSFRATFADVKRSLIPTALGMCTDDARILKYTNEAIQRLIERGRWWGTVVRARFCVTSGCITWPRQVAAVENIQLDGSVIPVRNQWYEFLEYRDPLNFASCTTDCSQCAPGYLSCQDRGTAPTVIDVVGNRKVRIYPTDLSDNGKRVLIQGYDENRLWVRTQLAGTWYDGEWLTLVNPHVTSTKTFSSITGIQKQATNMRVAIYEYNPANGGQRTLAIMEPDELVACYRRSFIPQFNCDTSCSSCDNRTVTAMVKLAYQPIASDEDWLLISSIPALKDCIMSLWKEQNNEPAEANRLFLKALDTLNHELRTFTGDRRSFHIAPFGTAFLNKHTVGYR